MTGMDSGGRPRQAGPLADDSTTRAAKGLGMADGNRSVLAVPVAFYGRTADAAGTGDSRADRHQQLALRRAVAAACAAWVATEFFDEDRRADSPWWCRPPGRSLLAALSAPGRVAATVVVAGPSCLLPGARRHWHPGSARIPACAARASRLWPDDRLGREYALLGRLRPLHRTGRHPAAGEQGPALRPVLPGGLGAAVFVEELGGHPARRRPRRPGGAGRVAGAGWPTVGGTGGAGGPSVERGRHRQKRAVPAMPGALAARVVESSASGPAWRGRPRESIPDITLPSRALAHRAGPCQVRRAGERQRERAGSTVVPGLGGGLQVRRLPGRSLACALSRARSSRARTARAAPRVRCGSAGVKVTWISRAPTVALAGSAARRPTRDGFAVMPTLRP